MSVLFKQMSQRLDRTLDVVVELRACVSLCFSGGVQGSYSPVEWETGLIQHDTLLIHALLLELRSATKDHGGTFGETGWSLKNNAGTKHRSYARRQHCKRRVTSTDWCFWHVFLNDAGLVFCHTVNNIHLVTSPGNFQWHASLCIASEYEKRVTYWGHRTSLLRRLQTLVCPSLAFQFNVAPTAGGGFLLPRVCSIHHGRMEYVNIKIM